jgi:hypothetical protein
VTNHNGLVELPHGLPEETEDLRAGTRIQVAGRLVSKDHVRFEQQGACTGNALLLSSGEFARSVPEPVTEAEGTVHPLKPRGVHLPAGDRG